MQIRKLEKKHYNMQIRAKTLESSSTPPTGYVAQGKWLSCSAFTFFTYHVGTAQVHKPWWGLSQDVCAWCLACCWPCGQWSIGAGNDEDEVKKMEMMQKVHLRPSLHVIFISILSGNLWVYFWFTEIMTISKVETWKYKQLFLVSVLLPYKSLLEMWFFLHARYEF